jgi:hypothetical protein
MRHAARLPRRWSWVVRALVAASLLAATGTAAAQDKRDAVFTWNAQKTQLYMTVSYRDVVDAEIRKKLTRGFTTTIVLTGAVYRASDNSPVSTTTQTCKITWHVWDEVYLVDVTRPTGSSSFYTTNLKRVFRNCLEGNRLLIATSAQLAVGVAVYVSAKVQVNPVSDEILQKLKRWVSRPTGTGTATPGDALFSTFTGLFLQRIGDAERDLKFTTKTSTPAVEKKK